MKPFSQSILSHQYNFTVCVKSYLNCHKFWCGCEGERAFILLNVRSLGGKKCFQIKKYIQGCVSPFSNYSSSCGTLTGRSHYASEKVVFISLCGVLGETEVLSETRFRCSLVLLWKAENRSLPIQCSFH